jgi:hypothetical protein
MNRLFYNGVEISRGEDLSIYKRKDFLPSGDVELELKTYKEYIVDKIRLKYSMDDEMAVLRQRDSKPEEFYEYNAYVEMCKAEAKAKLNL